MYYTKGIAAVLLSSSIMVLGLSFGGCSAMNTAIQKKDLDVQTKMSETVFLEPTAPEDKIVYFDFRNTSDKDINVKAQIESAFIQRGYTITQNPKEAKYMLQGNILKVGKSDMRESQSLLGSGFGGTGLAAGLTGGALAGGAAYAMGGNNQTAVGVGLAGAALGFLGDAMVKDIVYVMVTDLQIRERPLEGEVVTQTQKAKLAQGSSTTTSQDIQGGKVEWKTYRTRIVSTANKMNLEFAEAQPVLEAALSKSVSGIF
jgi:hypothetical protein